MCDWGEVVRMQEVTPSIYAFSRARSHQREENALVGGPKIIFYSQQANNSKFPLINGQTSPNNFEV
jgi:hypothetical protein